MKLRINRRVLEQTSFDSATPTGAAVVVHRFDRDGPYELAIMRDDEVVDRRELRVRAEQPSETSERTAAAAPTIGEPPAPALPVDLAALRPGSPKTAVLQLQAAGYAAFTSSVGEGHRVIITEARGDDRRQEFDSRRLEADDLFGVTLVRPGTYVATNTITGAQVQLRVAYPQIGSVPYRPPEPITLEAGADEFATDTVDLAPAQGVIFQIRGQAHIQIQLLEPDDGPAADEARQPRTRWVKPRRPEPTDSPQP
jgi:hypothetical protein